jgi:hypothetical protein
MEDEKALWLQQGDWKSYEAYVVGYLNEEYPNIVFENDVKVKGQLSSTWRQIDILARSEVPVAIECKYFGRLVDVKLVESFLSMLDDLGILIGVIITAKGYTKAALERAKNDTRVLSLEIISPDKFSEYQYIGAPLIYKEPLGILLQTPSGWLADTELTDHPSGALVFMYPLGRSLNGAMRNAAFIYANILTRPDDSNPLKLVSKEHEISLLHNNAEYQFTFELLELTDAKGVQRTALLRHAKGPPPIFGTEHALYLDYGTAVLMLVLNCPPNLEHQIVPLLITLYEGSAELKVTQVKK